MDVPTRLRAAMRNLERLRTEGSVTREALARAGRRASLLSLRHRWLGAPPRDRPYLAAEVLAQVELAASTVASGGTVTAVDTGSLNGRWLDEVGVSTFRDGVVSTTTYASDRARYRHPDDAVRVMAHPLQVHRKALFGPTVLVPPGELRPLAEKAMAEADLVLFHEMSADLHALGLPAPPTTMDTSRCALGIFDSKLSLDALCSRLGIDASGHHNSGNDARYTLDAALSLARPEVARLLRDRIVRIETRDRTMTELVMHPTRAPGLEDAFDAFREAYRATSRFHGARSRRVDLVVGKHGLAWPSRRFVSPDAFDPDLSRPPRRRRGQRKAHAEEFGTPRGPTGDVTGTQGGPGWTSSFTALIARAQEGQ